MENWGSLNKYEEPSVGEGPLGKEASDMLVEKESRTSVYQTGVWIFFPYEYRKSWSNLIRTIT